MPPTGSEAFGTDPDTPHNEARDQVREELLSILNDKLDDDEVSPDLLRRALRQESRADQHPQPSVDADRGN